MPSSSIDKEQTHLVQDHPRIKHEEKVKSLIDFLNEVVDEPLESLIIVDTIQQLGIKSLFQEQIKAILQWQYTHFSSLNHGKDDVYEIELHQSHVPTMEEYMPVALISIGSELTFVTSFLGMGDVATKDAFDWLLYSKPKIVKASQVIGRLMNDIAGHKFEQERGHVASSVECFMKQHGVTEQEAKKELCKQVVNAWKEINEEMRRPTVVPMVLLMRIINLARSTHAVYEDKTDHYVNAGTNFKEFVTCLLVNPLPM